MENGDGAHAPSPFFYMNPVQFRALGLAAARSICGDSSIHAFQSSSNRAQLPLAG
jgi:hypothetical protein